MKKIAESQPSHSSRRLGKPATGTEMFEAKGTSQFFDGTPCAGKLACTVWGGGKLGDNFKGLPITMV